MLDPSIIKAMVSSGCTVEQLASVVDAHLAIEHEKLLAKRAAGRQRQRRYMEKLKQNQWSYDASLTVTDRHEEGLSYVEEMDVKTMDVKEKEELPVKQEMLNQVPVSRARARKKPSTEFPENWPNPEVIQIGIAAGLSQGDAVWEIDAMRDWALSKDERRVSWAAFAAGWFKRSDKRKYQPSFVAKPLSQFQQDAKTRKEKYDRLAEFAYSRGTEDISEGGGPLGSPDDQPFPPNW